MPIEIKELQINVLVRDNVRGNNSESIATSGIIPQTQLNEIIAECVEQVLTILKEKQER